jgi:hypothetical protein
MRWWCPRQDSNLRTRLRRPVLYPLSYEGSEPESSNGVSTSSHRLGALAMVGG